ncbi:hypothetical protein DRN73_00435 [Candidatus Pacearchaeota archaeon]|nr:MAG: hypothetical protein DRN73_00435 [Candidatus Pacearchaeota archaeon]
MQRPFEVLKELFPSSGKPKEIYKGRSYLFKELNWEEIIQKSKPLKNKNFFWRFSPKRAFWIEEKIWPPQKIEIKVWLTSEYIEGRAKGVSKKIIKDLREGKYAIKRVLNLRGLFVDEAKAAFEEFMKEAILNGDKCVLIIHGRGLSSKGQPVLKTKVKEWLERGPFRKYVLAFTSARPCDGGAGATYVLLSSKPIKK